jgi:DNA-binding transcriptional LysR family regulator
MLLQLAIGGAGILRLSEHVVARSIHEGLLQPLLQDAQDPETYPLYALLPPGRPPRPTRPPPFERHSHVGAQRSDCLAGVRGLELRNPCASHAFDMS